MDLHNASSECFPCWIVCMYHLQVCRTLRRSWWSFIVYFLLNLLFWCSEPPKNFSAKIESELVTFISNLLLHRSRRTIISTSIHDQLYPQWERKHHEIAVHLSHHPNDPPINISPHPLHLLPIPAASMV